MKAKNEKLIQWLREDQEQTDFLKSQFLEIGDQIILDPTEQKLCTVVARARFVNARNKGVPNARKGSQSDWKTDLEGLGAEWSFCKGFNLFPDLTIFPRSSRKGEDLGDATLPNGMTVDIKTTTYPNGRLIAATWKLPKVDLFALMVGEFPTYEFRGFMFGSELLRGSRIQDLGHGDLYVADQHELLSYAEILRSI